MTKGMRKQFPHTTEQQIAGYVSKPEPIFATAKELIKRYPDYTYFGIRFVKCHAITIHQQTARTTTIQMFDREKSCSNYRKGGHLFRSLMQSTDVPDDLANYAILHDKKIIFMCSDFSNELEPGVIIENEPRLENILYVRDLAWELHNVAGFPEAEEIHEIDLFCRGVMESFKNAGGECGKLGLKNCGNHFGIPVPESEIPL